MDDKDQNIFQPRHPARGSQAYRKLFKELTAQTPKTTPRQRIELWDFHYRGYTYEGGGMDKNGEFTPETFIELVFKPRQFGRLLSPAESQLILSYMGEILKEAEAEEKLILEEQSKAKQEREDASCK